MFQRGTTLMPVPEPVVSPNRTSTRTDVEAALRLVYAYLEADGVWTSTLRWHVDRWLDRMLELRCEP